MSFGWGIYGGAEFKAESVNYPQIRRMKVARTTKLAEEPFEVPLADSWKRNPKGRARPAVRRETLDCRRLGGDAAWIDGFQDGFRVPASVLRERAAPADR